MSSSNATQVTSTRPAQRDAGTARRVRLSDIARDLGVSTATISKVVNDRTDVAEDTRRRVKDALAAAGYRKPNAGQTTDSAPLIDVIFERLDNVWGLEVMIGVEQEVRERRLGVVITESGDRGGSPAAWLDAVIARNPLGAIIVTSDLSEADTERLAAHGIPIVLLDPSGDPNPSAASIRADNWSGGLTATRHLITLGHRKIGIITGPMDMMCSRARLDGYRAAIEEANIPFDPSLCIEGEFKMASGLECAKQLLDRPDQPTAIFACNDLMAMGVYEAARVLRLRIPEDLSVVGFDDVQTAALMGPPLTTVHQPIREMSVEAVRMLLAMREGRHRPGGTIIPTSFIVRGSTAAPGAE
ncbi:LacI family DNA-binding transcriptional regulator [Bifidobacterium amazonense]|uniref:LacI family DNA-binding transcriptional regulator n=1 Tax=Bifidobacterium amazonense TaxID=2809027 RepID=A0ABS9VUB2_9BIFI|nr:LacI family DNA-binding transcriptional regulator [Bifidobacterium amazonense]MCH9275546.1 LacI family DNA-binding transcriptional regulator [Bifidobacterium amazonense]MCH9275579.1 LacI family DNA-binding transcriptional regulator [Bifidobacterium amazonense]